MPEAEALYRSVLQAQPDHADANHNLGVLALEVKNPEAARAFLKTALEVNRAKGKYWWS